MSDVQMGLSASEKRADSIAAHVKDVLAEKARARKTPAEVHAPYRNRYGQPSYYRDDGTNAPVESDAVASRTVAADCGNQVYRERAWECKGCGRPVGVCETCFRQSIHNRQMKLADPASRYCLFLTRRRRAVARPRLYRNNKPIVLEHIGPKPVVCQNERQVAAELRRHGLRSVRGPGQDA